MNSDGHIVSPRYSPDPIYLERMRDYCRTTPKAQWPIYLQDDVKHMRKSGRRSMPSSNPSTAGSES